MTQPLAEPDVNLSAHPAPIKQTRQSSDLPMYKEIHTFRRQPFQELTGVDFVAFEALELTYRPRHERLIDVSQQGIQPPSEQSDYNTQSIREAKG